MHPYEQSSHVFVSLLRYVSLEHPPCVQVLFLSSAYPSSQVVHTVDESTQSGHEVEQSSQTLVVGLRYCPTSQLSLHLEVVRSFSRGDVHTEQSVARGPVHESHVMWHAKRKEKKERKKVC